MNRRALGSIPADGSSSKMIGGLPTIAIATESFLLFPPDSLPANTVLYLSSPSYWIAYSTRAGRILFGIPFILPKYSMCSYTDKESKIGFVYGQ